MNQQLDGWSLTEGRIPGMLVTEDPEVSEVIAAVEAIRCDQRDPFVVLEALQAGEDYPNYCQALAREEGYGCEIRIYRGTEFTHMEALLLDSEGSLENAPNLGLVIAIFSLFIADPTAFPTVAGVDWSDLTGNF